MLETYESLGEGVSSGDQVESQAIQAGAISRRPNTGHFSLSTTVPLKPSPKSVAAPREHHHLGRFHVTFKMLKRQMYGRARPDLLRKRVLLAD